MNLSLRLSLAAGLLTLATASLAHAQAPYLETRPLTIHWNFTLTGVSGTTIGKRPLPVDRDGNVLGIDDPEKLNPNDRVTTEKGSLISYTVGNGEQDFIVEHLLRSVIENGNQSLTEEELTGRWELTAVREPQETVVGAATAPYAIYLSRIQPTRAGGRISKTYATTDLEVTTVDVDDPFSLNEDNEPVFNSTAIPTGLFLTFNQLVGAYNETLADGRVSKASGSITVAYSIGFNSVFAADPRYLAEPTTETDELGNEVEVPPKLGLDYHSRINFWNAFGSGILTAGIRTTPGPLPAVVPVNVKMTGVGSWSHLSVDYTGVPNDEIKYGGFEGIAPLRIKLGNAKFQRRELFIQNQP
jgi:hypothetical protein